MKYDRETRGQNFYALDANLKQILARMAPVALEKWDATLSDFGAWVGGAVDEEAHYTDRHGRPVLEAYSADGELVNRIRHNPAWEAVSREVYQRGAVGLNYGDDPAPYLITFAMGYLLTQSDVSLHCPVTMTGAVAYVLDRFAPDDVRKKYRHELTRMDGKALTGGTWATELHGGSDIGGTTTVARTEGDHVRLTGLKWFTSNANGGLALATARPEGAPQGTKGLGLYLVPTHLDDGTPNSMRFRRLKDKLGTCGVPTGEIDLMDAWAVEVAPPPKGFKLMMEALEFSRIQNSMAAIGLQRRAFLEAVSYMSHREAFGSPVFSYPMVRAELVKMLLQLESGCALAFEAARSFDDAHVTDLSDADGDRAWMRMVTALAKYQTAEDANVVCRAAIELIGGNAYTYDYATPRLLRDAQVLTVWEGPANIQALEVLRMIGNRYPGFESLAARIDGILAAAPADLTDLSATVAASFGECRAAVHHLRANLADGPTYARKFMAALAEVLAAALLLQEAAAGLAAGDARKAVVARLFVQDRLAPKGSTIIDDAEQWHQPYFEALIGYEPIPVEPQALKAAV